MKTDLFQSCGHCDEDKTWDRCKGWWERSHTSDVQLACSDVFLPSRTFPSSSHLPLSCQYCDNYCCSVAQSCLALCDSMDCRMPGFPVLHYLLEFAQAHVNPTTSSSVAPFSSCPQSSRHQTPFYWGILKSRRKIQEKHSSKVPWDKMMGTVSLIRKTPPNTQSTQRHLSHSSIAVEQWASKLLGSRTALVFVHCFTLHDCQNIQLNCIECITKQRNRSINVMIWCKGYLLLSKASYPKWTCKL